MTVVMSDVQMVLETIILEDLEFEPPCVGRPHISDCDHAAEWFAILSCGHDRLWCDDHLEAAKQLQMEYGGQFACSVCRHIHGDVITRNWNLVHISFLRPLDAH